MLMKVLLSCSHPSPDMPLRLIHVQHLPCLPGKRRVNLEEPLGNIWRCQVKNKNPLGKVLFIQVSEKFYKPLIYQFIFFP